jgi:nucleotide-binding universal stress UspA family protein
MLTIKKILLPVDFPIGPPGIFHQAATLARHFYSEMVMLHVVTPRSQAAGVPQDTSQSTGWNLLTEIIKEAQKQQDQALEAELRDLTIRSVLGGGDPAWTIVNTSEKEKADLIMMPSYGSTFEQFLLGSVAAKVLSRAECPVWTGAHAEGSQVQKFAVHNILCAVDLGPRSKDVLSWAAPLAAEFGARLTLAHITASVEFWGPGGLYVNQEWKTALVDDASQRMAKLQQETGIKGEVFIGSGDVPKGLSQAAAETKADLLVTGCYPYGTHLRTHGYAIICAVPIPILNI